MTTHDGSIHGPPRSRFPGFAISMAGIALLLLILIWLAGHIVPVGIIAIVILVTVALYSLGRLLGGGK